jgi:subtilisin family serine protease
MPRASRRPATVAVAVVISIVVSLATAAAPNTSRRAEAAQLSAPADASSTRAATLTGNRYIVTLAAGASPRAFTQARSSEMSDVATFHHALNGFAATMPAASAARLARDPRVVAVVADTPVELALTPTFHPGTSDTGALEPTDAVLPAAATVGQQVSAPWGLDRIDQRALPLSTTYTYSGTGAGVLVYVIDTGILATHQEFAGRVLPGATGIIDGLGSSDCNGHGTHVAGTVGGTTYGVAKAVTLVPVRVFGCDGSSSASLLVTALDWVISDHDPGELAIVNMSLRGPGNVAIDAAVERTIADGVVVVAAAGNDTKSACDYSPGRAPAAVTVAASTSTDTLASFSNTGTCVDLIAPGAGITSSWYTATNAAAVVSGTSMSSPHVAGAAAQLLQKQPSATPAQIASLLVSTATTSVVSGTAASSTPNRLLYVDPGTSASPVTTTTTLAPPGPSPSPSDPPVELPIVGFSLDTAQVLRLGELNNGDTKGCSEPCTPQFWLLPDRVLARDDIRLSWSAAVDTRVCLTSGTKPQVLCDLSSAIPLGGSYSGTVSLRANGAAAQAFLTFTAVADRGPYVFTWTTQRHEVLLTVTRPARALDPATGVVRARARLSDGSAVANGTRVKLGIVTAAGRTSRRTSTDAGRLAFPLRLSPSIGGTTATVRASLAQTDTLLAARSSRVQVQLR